ncbi:DUF6894 family protein [Allosphingosinicella sp.]|jgi:hypothetical protein|uniref:DUF6894 family protein n=1 Tax=Allosphingosinicella sp. TaxID=2823234 RepID=UPI002EF0D0C0
MTRYCFHIYNGNRYFVDELGRDCPSDAAARELALVDARSIMRPESRDGALNLSSFVEVQNKDEAATFIVDFSEALVPSP